MVVDIQRLKPFADTSLRGHLPIPNPWQSGYPSMPLCQSSPFSFLPTTRFNCSKVLSYLDLGSSTTPSFLLYPLDIHPQAPSTFPSFNHSEALSESCSGLSDNPSIRAKVRSSIGPYPLRFHSLTPPINCSENFSDPGLGLGHFALLQSFKHNERLTSSWI